jgi:hypothetical protein
MADDMRIDYLQRHAAACRKAAAEEANPAMKAVHLQNAAGYMEELKRLRAGAEGSSATA